VALPVGSILPCSVTLRAAVSSAQSYLRLSVAADDSGSAASHIGELVFGAPEGAVAVEVRIEVASDGAMSVRVLAEEDSSVELASLSISTK
jgi:hypothetical protein